MLIAGIFLILLISAIAAYVMRKRGTRMAYVWLTLGFTAFVVLLLLLFIPSGRIGPFIYQNWFRSETRQVSLNFRIGQINWPVVTALITVHMAFLLTATARQEFKRESFFWIIEAAEVALSFAILTAADLWTVVLTWTAMDVFTVLYQMFIRRNTSFESMFRSYLFKLAGSLLLTLNAAQINARGQSLLLESLPASNSASLFFSAILHSGILPFKSPVKSKQFIETLLDYFTYFLTAISSLFLIVYLSKSGLPLFLNFGIQILFLAASFYFIYLWLKSPDDVSGSYFVLYAFTGFIGYRFLVDLQSGLVNWFVILMVCLSWLQFYRYRGRSTAFFPIMLLVSMTGLPFSLISFGTGGVFASRVTLASIIIIIFHSLFLAGFIKFIFQEKKLFEEMESSFQITYLAGLFLPILSLVAITIRSMGSLIDELSFWWAGLSVIGFSIGIYFWLKKRNQDLPVDEVKEKSGYKRPLIFLSLNWFFTGMDFIVSRIRPLVAGFSNLLEGEGAILWSIVFLALLITLLRTG